MNKAVQLDPIEILEIDNWKFALTSECFPEQYDVFDEDGDRVGYLRVDGGEFEVRVPDSLGELIYKANTKGGGDFIDDEERNFYLGEARKAIRNK